MKHPWRYIGIVALAGLLIAAGTPATADPLPLPSLPPLPLPTLPSLPPLPLPTASPPVAGGSTQAPRRETL